MWCQWSKPLKVTIGTCFLLYVITVLDSLKKKPPDKVQNSDEGRTDYGEVKTFVGYSLEHKIAQDLQGVYQCDLENISVPVNVQNYEEKSLTYNADSGTYILSSYYDNRLQPFIYIRTIALVPSNLTLFCQIWNNAGDIQVRKATILEIWSKDWNAPKSNYYPALISCLTMEDFGKSSKVSYVLEPCQEAKQAWHISERSVEKVPHKETNSMKTIVCVKPLRFQKNIAESLQEWVELNLLLGANRIFLYYFNLSKVNMKKLKPFISKGLVQFKKFRIPKTLQSGNILSDKIWFKRKLEILAYNDCFYNNLYKADFVVPLDIDEIIVPKSSNNWYEMFETYFQNNSLDSDWKQSLDIYSYFSVRNAYFFKKYPEKALVNLKIELPLKNNTNLVGKSTSSIFSRQLRSVKYSPKIEAAKSFIPVKNALTIFNHFTFHELRPGQRPIIFPTELAQLSHFREFCDPLLIDKCEQFISNVTYDNSLARFINKIKER